MLVAMAASDPTVLKRPLATVGSVVSVVINRRRRGRADSSFLGAKMAAASLTGFILVRWNNQPVHSRNCLLHGGGGEDRTAPSFVARRGEDTPEAHASLLRPTMQGSSCQQPIR